MTHQLATGRMATLIKLAFAGGAKLLATFAAFVLTAIVTRNLPHDDAGMFLLGFTIIAVFSVVLRLGLDNVALRFLSAHGTNEYAQEKFNRALLWTLTISLPFTILGMSISGPIAKYVFGKSEFADVLFWILPSLPCMAIFYLFSFAYQSQHRVVLTTLFQNLGVATVFITLVGTMLLSDFVNITVVLLSKLYSISSGVVLLLAVSVWLKQANVRLYITTYNDREMFSPALNLWVASLMALSVQWSGVLIAGAFHTSEDVALLTAAQRTALLTSFILMIVNIVVAPKYAKCWKEGDVNEIRRIAKLSTRGMLVIAAPVFCVMLIYPHFIMSLFGEGYAEGGHLLAIMAVGQFINVITGSVGYLLNMSGHEKDFNRVTIFSGPVAIVLALIFSNYWGVTGTAVAIAIGVGIQHLGAAVMVKKRLGFYSIF